MGLGDGERPLGAFGEIGLTGELRHAAHADRRQAEAAKFGLGRVVAPSDRLRTVRAALADVLDPAEPVARAA